MARNDTTIRRGKGAVPGKTVQDNSFAYPNRDVEPLRVHVHDPSRAHMASSIGIVDSSSCFISDEVEGALQELCVLAGSGFAEGRLNGLVELGTYTGTYPNITIDTTSKAHINGGTVDISGKTFNFSTGTDPVGGAPTSNPGAYYLYIETNTASANYQNLVASTTLPPVGDEKVLIAKITHNGASYTAEKDARFFVRDLDRKIEYSVRQGENIDAWSEGCFASLEAAFLWLEVYRDRSAGVTDEMKATVIVRGHHILTKMITADVGYSVHIIGDGESSIQTSAGGYTDPYLLNLGVTLPGGSNPSDGVYIEGITFKNSTGVTSLQSMVNLNGTLNTVTINRCFTAENVEDVGLISATQINQSLLVRNCDLNGPLTRSNTLGLIPATRVLVEFCRFYGIVSQPSSHSMIELGGTYFSIILSNCDITLYPSIIETTAAGSSLTLSNCRISRIDAFSSGGDLEELVIDNCQISLESGHGSFFGGNSVGFGKFQNTKFVGNSTASSSEFCSFTNAGELTISGCSFENWDVFSFNNSSFKLNINNCNFNTANFTIANALSVDFHNNLVLWDDSVGNGNPRFTTSGGSIEIFRLVDNTLVQDESVFVVSLTSSVSDCFIKGNSFVGGSGNQILLDNAKIIDNIFDSTDTSSTVRSTGHLLQNSSTSSSGCEISGNTFSHGFGGIDGNALSNSLIHGNTFKNIANNSGSVKGVIECTANSAIANLTVSGNQIYNCGFGSVTGATDGYLLGVYIDTNTNILEFVSVIGNSIKDLVVDTNVAECVHIGGQMLNVSVKENTLIPFTAATLKDATGIVILPRGNSYNVSVDGNNISSSDPAEVYMQGIFFLLSSVGTLDVVSVSDNTVRNAYQNCVLIETSRCDPSNVLISGNILHAVSSANTKTEPGVIRIDCDNSALPSNITLDTIRILDNDIKGPNIGVNIIAAEQTTSETSFFKNISISGNSIFSDDSDWTSPEGVKAIYIKKESPSGTSVDGSTENLEITNNTIDWVDGQAGISIECTGGSRDNITGLLIKGNNLINAANHGVFVYSNMPGAVGKLGFISKVRISDNILNVNGTGATSGSTVGFNYGLKFDIGSITLEDVVISDNQVYSYSNGNTIRGQTLYIQGQDFTNASVENILVENNYFYGESGNGSTEYSGNVISLESAYSFSDFTFKNNKCDTEFGLHLDLAGNVNDAIESISFVGNETFGRHAFVLDKRGTAANVKLETIKIEGNTHKQNANATEINSDYTFAFEVTNNGGVALPVASLFFKDNVVVCRNSPDPAVSVLGGFSLFNMKSMQEVSVCENQITNFTAPAVLVSCNGVNDGLMQSVSIDNNIIQHGILDTWLAGREDAALNLEYTDTINPSTYPTRDWSANISISGNQLYDLELKSLSACGIWITENPDVSYATYLPAGLVGFSVNDNKVSKSVSRYGVRLFAENIKFLFKDISLSRNSIVAQGRFPDSDPFGYELPGTGILVDGPVDPASNAEVENITVSGNLIHHHTTTSYDTGIKLEFTNNVTDLDPYIVYNLKVDNNEILTYVDTILTYGIDLTMTCGVRGLSASYNSISAKVSSTSPEYPAAGLILHHKFNQGVEFIQQGSSSDGNAIHATGGATAKVAGSSGSLFSVYTNAAGTLLQGVDPASWENLTIDGNKINYNSRYSRSTGSNTQYPIANTADLVVTAVYYSGLKSTGRSLVVVPIYGMSISNNTLRGFWKSNEGQQFAGMLLNTCPVYGRWSPNDPSPSNPSAGNASVKFVCQGWMIQSNNTSGYAVWDQSGSPTYYGFDQYHLYEPFDTFLAPIGHLDNAGLCTGNVSYDSGSATSLTEGNITTIWYHVGTSASRVNLINSAATKTIN